MINTLQSSKIISGFQFFIEVHTPGQLTKNCEIVDCIVAGIDPRNDLILIDPKVSIKHFIFRKKNNSLSVQYLGKDGDSTLNNLLLEKNKFYLLEEKDVLRVGKLKIIIFCKAGINQSTPRELPKSSLHFSPIDELSNLSNSINVSDVTSPKQKTVAIKKNSFLNFSTIPIIPFKIYAFGIDLALTYFILSFVIPKLGILLYVQKFLYLLSSAISNSIPLIQSSMASMKILSLLEFFICFHLLMISISLILGTTAGSFLVGLHPKKSSNHFLAIRFKASLYAFFNIMLLPLLLSDLPVYRGKNLKELFTFTERELRPSIIFHYLRKVILPTTLIASLFSPFFLDQIFNSSITMEKNSHPKYINIHENKITSNSNSIGISLNSSLGIQYALLPYFNNKKVGLTLFDLKNNKSLHMIEENRTSISEFLFKLRYANPLASLNVPNRVIDNEVLKNKSLKYFNTSLMSLGFGVWEYGPFLANIFLFKTQFLERFNLHDDFLLNPFDKDNPAIKISSLSSGPVKRKEEQKVFLFGRNEIIQYSLVAPKNSGLLEVFTNGVLAGFKFNLSKPNSIQDPQILEVLEAFESRNDSVLLTYYINEAKKVKVINNSDWSHFFKKNIDQTKRAIMANETRISLNKKREKSFDNIINTL